MLVKKENAAVGAWCDPGPPEETSESHDGVKLPLGWPGTSSSACQWARIGMGPAAVTV
jgi:hypothetical protein